MAAYMKTEAYKQYLIDSREKRRKRKESYRRRDGIPPSGTVTKAMKEAANSRRDAKKKDEQMWCDAHVNRYHKVIRARNKSKSKYETDPKYMLYHRIKRWMHKHLGDGLPSRKWAMHLGYTPDELRRHLEKQFKNGMGWHNKGMWHIDHIVPVASFNISSVDCPDFTACFGLHNLRPVWAKENMRKSDRLEFLL